MSKRRVITASIKITGKLCGYFTAIQAVIWLILTYVGFIGFFINTGNGEIAVAFRVVYMDLSTEDSPSVIVKPIGFIIIVTFYFFISALWLYASVNLICEYNRGDDVSAIKRSSRFWMRTTLIICLVDLIIFIVFLVDFVLIGKDDTVKTRGVETNMNIMNLKKFNKDFKKLMTQEYLNEAMAKLDELYTRKFNIKDSPKSEQDDKPLRRRKRTALSIMIFPVKLGWYFAQTGWSLAQTGWTVSQFGWDMTKLATNLLTSDWNITGWVYSWLPSLPIPTNIKDLIGNPFQPLLDKMQDIFSGMNESQPATVPAPVIPVIHPPVKLFNPKMPSFILMIIALRGAFIWITNCFLLALMFCVRKEVRDVNGVFSWFTNLFRR